MFLFICLPIYFVLFVDNLLWKSWSVPKLGWGCIIEFKNKNKVEEKLNGREDAMKGHWGIYHRQFKMCLYRKGSVWCVPPKYFCRKIVEVGVKKDLKEGCQKEGLSVNDFLSQILSWVGIFCRAVGHNETLSPRYWYLSWGGECLLNNGGKIIQCSYSISIYIASSKLCSGYRQAKIINCAHMEPESKCGWLQLVCGGKCACS